MSKDKIQLARKILALRKIDRRSLDLGSVLVRGLRAIAQENSAESIMLDQDWQREQR